MSKKGYVMAVAACAPNRSGSEPPAACMGGQGRLKRRLTHLMRNEQEPDKKGMYLLHSTFVTVPWFMRNRQELKEEDIQKSDPSGFAAHVSRLSGLDPPADYLCFMRNEEDLAENGSYLSQYPKKGTRLHFAACAPIHLGAEPPVTCTWISKQAIYSPLQRAGIHSGSGPWTKRAEYDEERSASFHQSSHPYCGVLALMAVVEGEKEQWSGLQAAEHGGCKVWSQEKVLRGTMITGMPGGAGL
ncbi:hypothetical protein B0H14DRAFT_2559730 [Mycena olivaceomarginata]|nr:hypothetical protein B0H14DRAFT_2559730 [Mycena olivaceomarginata]